MWKLIPLVVVQSAFLCGGQVLLKFALSKMEKFNWSFSFFYNFITNFWFLGCGICFGIASLLWMYILKKFPFSVAYPMVSLSYVFGMLAAIIFFKEQVSFTRWFGVFMIMAGCCLIVK